MFYIYFCEFWPFIGILILYVMARGMIKILPFINVWVFYYIFKGNFTWAITIYILKIYLIRYTTFYQWYKTEMLSKILLSLLTCITIVIVCLLILHINIIVL